MMEQNNPFKIKSITRIGTWNRALNMARRTVGKEPIEKDPSDKWKAQMLLAEHSPIRMVEYDTVWENIKQRITVHYVRHHAGIEKFVHTQRDDRNDKIINSDDLPQGALNDMALALNAQAIINISKVRLCNLASTDTRKCWQEFLNELEKIDPVLVSKCKTSCIYRGFCPEDKSCGYDKTESFRDELVEYRNVNI